MLICRGAGKLKNIGDYIQSLAGEQFIGNDYCYVERETLNSLRYVDWIKGPGPYPSVLDESFYNDIINSKIFFVER